MYYDFSGYANSDGTPKPEAPKQEKPKVFPERSCNGSSATSARLSDPVGSRSFSGALTVG